MERNMDNLIQVEGNQGKDRVEEYLQDHDTLREVIIKEPNDIIAEPLIAHWTLMMILTS